MLNRMFILSTLINIAIGCRTVNPASVVSADEDSTVMVNHDFDWLGAEANGVATPVRTLRYCFHPLLRDEFRNSFDLAATKINAAQTGWVIKKGGNDARGDCPDQWTLKSRTIDAQDHIKVREDSSRPQLQPQGAQDHVRLDRFLVTGEQPLDPGIDPNNPNPVPPTEAPEIRSNLLRSQTDVADFFYEKAFRHRCILAGEVVFFTKGVNWSSQPSSGETVDPDLVALHILGHVLRLDHSFYSDNDDIQILTCGNKHPGDNSEKGALGIFTPAESIPLNAKALGDDITEGNRIFAGKDGVFDSAKTSTIMFPYLKLGEHCANPTGNSQKADRINLSSLDIAGLKASADLSKTCHE